MMVNRQQRMAGRMALLVWAGTAAGWFFDLSYWTGVIVGIACLTVLYAEKG